LGLKSTKDYTTEELLKIGKNEGVFNASTGYDRINYWFRSTGENTDLAIKSVCNVALNDLTKVTEQEFATERDVVSNEAKRAHDEAQMMFYRNSTSSLVGYENEDNTIGSPDTIDTFTLEDAIVVKNIFLTNNRSSYNIVYDNKFITEDEILNKVISELSKYNTRNKGSLVIPRKNIWHT